MFIEKLHLNWYYVIELEGLCILLYFLQKKQFHVKDLQFYLCQQSELTFFFFYWLLTHLQ